MHTFTRNRGFTLIDIAIVMVVLGVILGGVLLPIHNLSSIDAYQREREQMRLIKLAIYGYATRNQTRGNAMFGTNNDIFAVSNNGNGTRQFPLPEGRPYLPCPDANGDGYEDRANYDQIGQVFTQPALGHGVSFYLTDFSMSPNEQPLASIGACATSRGLLPWRTLGVSPIDSWGNIYAYYADAIASDVLVGFNQNTIIDEFDVRTQIRETMVGGSNFLAYGKRQLRRLEISRDGAMVTVNNYAEPLIICNGLPCGVTVMTSATSTVTTGGFELAEGEVANGNFNVLYRNFSENDVVQGVPFAIVSHGKNGAGAVNYHSMVNLKTSSAKEEVRCLTTNTFDRNAELYNVTNSREQPTSPNWENSCLQPMGQGGSSGVLVSVPYGASGSHNNSAVLGYDDIVMWASMGELIDVMQSNQILPAPDITVLRSY